MAIAGGDHRLPVHGDPELDWTAADPGHALLVLVIV
jgi:hypothetical protein